MFFSKLRFFLLISLVNISVFAQNISMQNGTISQCSGTFFDSGGDSGDYGPNENLILTICPDMPDMRTVLEFTVFEMASGALDTMTIYDSDTADPSTIIGVFSGSLTNPDNTILNYVVASNGNLSGCLTIEFNSTSSAESIGWEADISCSIPCPEIDPNVSVISPEDVTFDGESFLICYGQQITLFSDATLSFGDPDLLEYEWDFGEFGVGVVNSQTAIITYLEPGFYTALLTITYPDCPPVTFPVEFKASPDPEFNLSVNVEAACVGDIVEFSADPRPVLFTKECGAPLSETVFIPDRPNDQIVPYSSSITNECFRDDQLITSESDVIEVCVTMEHSSLADLEILLIGPNGSEVILKEYDESNALNENFYLGEALDSSPAAGNGFRYCFNLSATDLLINGPTVDVPNPTPGNPDGTFPAIAPGDYLPVDSFSNLIGEPLNGEWILQITDNIGIDDGWIFEWEITFDETLIPEENTFQAEILKAEWVNFPGQGLIVEVPAPALEPDENGEILFCQEFEIIDSFGCSFFEEICIEVFPSATINNAEDLYLCDEDPDTPTEFDLTVNDANIFGGQDPDIYELSYHNSLDDAQSGDNPILNPETYLASPRETIYIRLVLIEGGCIATGSFDLIDSVFLGGVEDLGVCSTDGQGIFDLTQQIQDLLGPDQSLSTHSITFHTDETEADLGINPIQVPGSFQISTPSQTVYVRIEDNVDNTCFKVGEFELILFSQPEVQTAPLNLEQCTLLEQSFDLTENDQEALGISASINTSITYHESFADATTGENAIENPDDYENLSDPQTIWIRIENAGQAECFDTSSFEISVIESALINQDVTPLVVCDDDNDGFFNNFNLNDKDGEISLLNPVVEISYHLTELDALNNVGALSSPYSNVVQNTQTIYYRAVDSTVDCVQVNSFEIQVVDSPLLTPITQPLIGCDDNNDGVLEFDLTQVEFEALGSLVPADLEITYHISFFDAQNSINSIAQPTTFQNTSNPQTIWLRVEDITNENGCFDIEPLELQVFETPIITFAEPFAACDDETGGGLSDEIATFDFNEVIDEITQVNNELLVEFFETEDDLTNNIQIDPIDSYQNISNPQTIFIKATSETSGCVTISNFTIVVEPTPSLAPTLEALEICDPDNDGFAEFDLEAIIPDILNNEPDVTITFHLTQAQADLGVNPIDISEPYGTNNPNIQTIYVRAENTGPNGDDGSGCYDTRPLDLIVNTSPEIIELEDISRCDDESANGFARFDLTINTENAIGNQNADDVDVTYHETQEFAELGINNIAVPTNYLNQTNPQTIYVRIEDPETGCYDLYNSSNDVNNTFTISVEALPDVNSPTDLEVCDDDNVDDPFPQTVFDLTVKEPEIAGVPFVPENLIFTYYETQADLDNDLNPIPDPTQYTNANQPQDIFIKVIDSSTENQCFDTTVMTINVLPLPSPSETDPDVLRLKACDDDNDGVASTPFDLTESGVLIAESETVSVSYYLTESGANTEHPDDLVEDPTAYINDPSLNLIGDNGIPTNIQIIYVRVDNDVMGNFCYVIVPIELQVNPAPQLNPNGDPFAYTLCEDDPSNPGVATIFSIEDITTNLWDFNNGSSDVIIPLLDPNTFPTQNIEDFTFSYHLTEQEAEDGENAVLPGEQVSDGDILYIRIVNIETQCFNTNLIGQVVVVIEPRPAIAEEDPDNIIICADIVGNPNLSTVDLTVQDEFINPGEPANTIVVYYAGMMDYNNAIPIADPANYQTSQTPQTIIAEVVDTITLCESVSFVSFDIIVNPLPDFDITGFDGLPVCFDENGNLIDNEQSPPVIDTGLPSNNFEFVWELNGVVQAETSPSIIATLPGTYTVTVTNLITGCFASSSATIIESSPPVFEVTVISPSFTDNHVIEVTVIEGSGEFEFQLDDGEWIPLAPGQTTLTFTNVLPGTRIIRGRDQGGCGEVEAIVTLIDYPRYFTPNEDGFNDTWNITSLSNIENSGIFIFDRYGKLLKQISPSGEGWDGTFNGKQLPSQSYWFRVEFTEPATGNTSTFRSHFVLKR
jgi:gliding motility-associated-like protein